MILNTIKDPHKFLCKVKFPLKINFFIWLVFENTKLLTKDNKINRGWLGDITRQFCSVAEMMLLITYFELLGC